MDNTDVWIARAQWALLGVAALGFEGWVGYNNAERAPEVAARSAQQARAERLVSEAGMSEYLTGLCAAALEDNPRGVANSDWRVAAAMHHREVPFSVVSSGFDADAFVWRSVRRPLEDWEAAAVDAHAGEVEDSEGCPFRIDDAGNATLPGPFVELWGF